jgi:hypothetical protein
MLKLIQSVSEKRLGVLPVNRRELAEFPHQKQRRWPVKV